MVRPEPWKIIQKLSTDYLGEKNPKIVGSGGGYLWNVTRCRVLVFYPNYGCNRKHDQRGGITLRRLVPTSHLSFCKESLTTKSFELPPLQPNRPAAPFLIKWHQ